MIISSFVFTNVFAFINTSMSTRLIFTNLVFSIFICFVFFIFIGLVFFLFTSFFILIIQDITKSFYIKKLIICANNITALIYTKKTL